MNGTENVHIPTLSTFTQQHPELKCVYGSSSGDFNVLVADNGSVWFAGQMGWGRGQLKSRGAFEPLKVPSDYHIVSVSSGYLHVIFTARNGTVFTFGGNNDYG